MVLVTNQLPCPADGHSPYPTKRESCDVLEDEPQLKQPCRLAQRYSRSLVLVVDDNGQFEFTCSSGLKHMARESIPMVLERLAQFLDTQISCSGKAQSWPRGNGAGASDSNFPHLLSLCQSSAAQCQFQGRVPSASQTGTNQCPSEDQIRNDEQLYISAPALDESLSPTRGAARVETSKKRATLHRNRSMQEQGQQNLRAKVFESKKWKKWFSSAFTLVPKGICTIIAQEWITLIQPEKENTQSYSGIIPIAGDRNEQIATRLDSTMPSYWPLNVPHEMPYLMSRNALLELLQSILTGTPHLRATIDPPAYKYIKARDLLEVLNSTGDEMKSYGPIIKEIMYVRIAIETYEEGGTDCHTVLEVTNYPNLAKMKKAACKRGGTPRRTRSHRLQPKPEGYQPTEITLQQAVTNPLSGYHLPSMMPPTPSALSTADLAESGSDKGPLAMTASFRSTMPASRTTTELGRFNESFNGIMQASRPNQLMLPESQPPELVDPPYDFASHEQYFEADPVFDQDHIDAESEMPLVPAQPFMQSTGLDNTSAWTSQTSSWSYLPLSE